MSSERIAETVDRDYEKETQVMACIEIKICTSENTIVVAEDTLTNHDRIIYCSCNDGVFKYCVPSINREKILHQDAISNYNIGIFVTSKVEEEDGSIFQILNITISYAIRLEHQERLVPVTK